MDRINLAIIGKSGVGKSSLLNYLFDDENAAEVGTGKPVTKKGFHKYQKELNDKQYTIYDSNGLEAGEASKWLDDFEEFIGPMQTSSEMQDWLHSCIYCLSGASARIEPFEKQILEKLKEKHLNPVVVITKADSKDADELAIEIERMSNVKPVKVTSISKKTFSKYIKRNGKDEVLKNLSLNSKNTFMERVGLLLKLIEKDRLKEIFYNNYKKLIKSILSSTGSTISEKDYESLPIEFNENLKNDLKKLEIDINIKRNDAERFLKFNLNFEYFKYDNKISFNAEEFEEPIKWYEGLLLFTVLSPVTLAISIKELFQPSVDKEAVLKSLKDDILKKVSKDEELEDYLDRRLITDYEYLKKKYAGGVNFS